MTFEELEIVTQEYLQKVKSELEWKYPEKMEDILRKEHNRMVDDFVNMLPDRFERYRERFEFNSINNMRQEETEKVIQEIYNEVNFLKRSLEEGNQIEDIERKQQIQEKQQEPENYKRKAEVEKSLEEMFESVIPTIRRIEFNINYDALKRNCKEIIANHIDNIEKNGFVRLERDTIKQEVQDYIRTNKNATCNGRENGRKRIYYI